MLNRLIRVLGWLCVAGSVALMLAWALARIVSDRWLLSQYLAWVPSHWIILPAIVSASLGTLAFRIAVRSGPAPRSQRLAAGTLASSVLCLLLMGLGEYRWHAAVLGGSATARGPAIHLVHCNLSSEECETFDGSFARLSPPNTPDILLMTTPQHHDAFARSLAALGPGFNASRFATFVCVSRFACLDKGLVPLNIDVSAAGGEVEAVNGPEAGRIRRWLASIYNRWASSVGASRRTFRPDATGFVIWFRLDTTAILGRPIVIWMIDLPSDPLMFRWLEAAQVRRRLDELSLQTDASGGRSLLPPADIIVGDFNIPRGSASLGRIIGPGYSHAFDLGGWGSARSWPRSSPLLAIDNMFLADWLSCPQYDLVTPPISDHRAQSAVIVVRSRP